jgi:hypothetical protein
MRQQFFRDFTCKLKELQGEEVEKSSVSVNVLEKDKFVSLIEWTKSKCEDLIKLYDN